MRISIERCLHTVLTAVAVGIVVVGSIDHARAGVIRTAANIDFAASPATISLGGGSYAFSAIPGAPIGTPTANVATTGSDLVSSLGGGVADFAAGASIDQIGELYGFSSFLAATVIPNSAAVDFIGLEFSLVDGNHFGYAELAGTTLIGYAYQSVAGAGIVTNGIPEPASLSLLGAALVGLACSRRRGGRGSPGAPGPAGETD